MSCRCKWLLLGLLALPGERRLLADKGLHSPPTAPRPAAAADPAPRELSSARLISLLAQPDVDRRRWAEETLTKRLHGARDQATLLELLLALNAGRHAALTKKDDDWKLRIEGVQNALNLERWEGPCPLYRKKVLASGDRYTETLEALAAVARALDIERPRLDAVRRERERVLLEVNGDVNARWGQWEMGVWSLSYQNELRRALEKHGLRVASMASPKEVRQYKGRFHYEVPISVERNGKTIPLRMNCFRRPDRIEASGYAICADLAPNRGEALEEAVTRGERLRNDLTYPFPAFPSHTLIHDGRRDAEEVEIAPRSHEEWSGFVRALAPTQSRLQRRWLQRDECYDGKVKLPRPPRRERR